MTQPVNAAIAPVVIADSSFATAIYGEIHGRSAVHRHILGSRILGWHATSDLEDVCEYLDTTKSLMNTPGVGQTLYLISTSAADAVAGTGARTVRIVYLDASGIESVMTVTLNGTTPVSLGTGFAFIQWMEVATVGSGGVSAGNLSITSTNGTATVATTFERITAGGNRSMSGRYKIPTGYMAYLHDWSAGCVGAANQDCRLRSDIFSDDLSLSPGVFHFRDRLLIANNANDRAELHNMMIPANAVVKVSSISTAAGAANRLDVSFTFIMIAD